MAEPIYVLLVEDDPRDAELILRELARAGLEFRSRRIASADEFARALSDGRWDIILCDYKVPAFGALPAFAMLRESGQQLPFIVVTGTIDEETAVECLKTGIDNYILKENLARLAPAVRQAIQMADERRRSRLLEDQVRQSQKMEAVGRLAGGIAHDFNNLLTVIFANTARLRSSLAASTELAGELDGIEEAARQAKSVTNSLLALCHKSVTCRAPIDLGALVNDASRLLRRVLPATIELTVQTPTTPIYVNADASQLHQVLMNLAINARDAIPAAGKLRFTVAPLPPTHCNGADHSTHVALSVEDTGTGMTGDVAAHAFEPFFTTKPRGQGTGLGLSVVHGIIADHEGRVELVSKPGAGTRITIVLPTTGAVPSVAGATDATRDIPDSVAGGLAIVAEDNDLIRGLLVGILRGMGFQTREAADGEAALGTLRDEPAAALLILDLDLPKVSGAGVLDQVRARPVPLATLVITGNPHFSLENASPRTILLRKPFSIDEFRSAVLGLLRSLAV